MSILGNLFAADDKQSGPVLVAPSWQELDATLRAIEPADERRIHDDAVSSSGSRGPASHKASLRLFDAPDGFEPEVTLYRDTAAWCPYCEKVWLMLEEKGIPYRVEKVPMSCFGDKPSTFFSLSPSGGIPVAVIKGRVIRESNDIMALLEKEFPSAPRMWPSDSSSPLAQRVTQLLALERRLFSQWFSWLTSNSEAPRASMLSLLSTVDTELSRGDGLFLSKADGWTGGVSVVDCMFAPFLERMDASLLFYKGISLRGSYPHIKRWFSTMEARTESYAGIRSDFYTHITALPPQIGNIYSAKSGDAAVTSLISRAQAEVMGGAWRLDVKASDMLEPMFPADEIAARRDAARKVLANGPALVGFALRGVGSGKGGYRAPLADPKASPNERYRNSVDSAFRLVVQNLLAPPSLPPSLLPSHPVPKEVKECLLYVRDRVSVPRDMTPHGARLLRAHLNWLVEA